MKITILKENLNKGLNITEKISGKNLTLPILNNVLISTDKNFLNLAATNLETGINYWTLAKIEKQGKITIPAKFLFNLISSLPDKKINLEVKNNLLFIECENYKAQIKGFNPEEFPIIPVIKTENFIEINNSLLSEGLSQVVDFCASTQIKPELSGIYFQIQKDRILLTATDSFRLAEKTLYYKKSNDFSYSSGEAKEYSFILPQKTTQELLNILSEKSSDNAKENKLKVYFSPNQILFEFPMLDSPSSSFPQLRFISRLIEGEFPDYQEIIPKKHKTQAVLAKDVFLNQIKTASLFSGKINEVKIKIDPSKNKIEIFSQNPELGENKSSVAAQIKGSPLEISLNYKFLLDGLLNIKTSEIILEFNSGDEPVILKPVGDSSYLYVVMPIKP